MRLQRIVANRSSRLEGWTYATVGGNSSYFAPQRYSFNAWDAVGSCGLWKAVSLSIERHRIESIDGTIEPSNQKLSVNTVWNMKWIRKKWRHLSPLSSHRRSARCSSLPTAHFFGLLGVWCYRRCLVLGHLQKGCVIFLSSFSSPFSPSVTEGDRVLRRWQQWT
jgi:hypothetical protein